MKALDNDFFEPIDIPYWYGERIAISGNDFLLLPCRAVKNGHMAITPYFVLSKIASPDNSDSQLEIESTKLIKQDIFPGMIEVSRVQTFFNRFIVVKGVYTYRIDTDGSINFVSDERFNIFQYKEELYAFALPNLESITVNYYKPLDKFFVKKS